MECPVKALSIKRRRNTGSGQPMRRMANATGARLPVPRQPLNLSERHFSSITRNPTHTHSHRAGRRGPSRFTTLGSSGLSSWGKVAPHPGKRGFKGKSANKEQNEKRARARATGEIRRKCLCIGADHLVTLTYRDNVEDRERVLTDLERLRRMLSRGGYSMPYVAGLECQKRGAIHPHLAVRGFQDIRLLRRCWYKIVGKAQGQVNVKGPRPGTSPVKLARSLSKYISKGIDSQPREFEEHRYFCSLGIRVPTEQLQIVLTRNARDAQSKLFFFMINDTLRRVGDYCTVRHWIGGAGTFGWISGFEDPTCHRSRNTASPPHVPGWGTNS